jgi:hypothetical protein
MRHQLSSTGFFLAIPRYAITSKNHSEAYSACLKLT